jgi:hypothetical protein
VRRHKSRLKAYPAILAKTPEAWFDKAKNSGVYIECGIRGSRMHKKHCEYMMRMGGVARHPHGPNDPTDFDIILRSTGACTKCPVYRDALDTELD